MGKEPKTLNKVVTFAAFYDTMKLKRIERTINNEDELHSTIFDKELKPRIPLARRPGRPKFKWAEKGVEEYLDMMRKNASIRHWRHLMKRK